MPEPPSPQLPAWARLQALTAVLLGPEGCPWDREQTLVDLAGHLVEESFEVLHAAGADDLDALAEELGDTAFLLALVHQKIIERGGPALDTILARTADKIIRRHPHVFAGRKVVDAREASKLWEKLKRAERARNSPPSARTPIEALPPAPPALPALLRAHRVQQKAAAVGFDWPDAVSVLSKIEEELQELRAVLETPGAIRADRVAEETGDLLFAVVNLTRALGLEAEATLREATEKFRDRFNRMAERIGQAGLDLESLPLDTLEAYWQRAKRDEDAAGGLKGTPTEAPRNGDRS